MKLYDLGSRTIISTLPLLAPISLAISPGGQWHFQVVPTYDGRYEDTLEMVFAYPHGTQFIISRRVCGVAGSREDQEELKPEAPYKKEKYIPPNTDGPVIPTSHLPGSSGIKWVNFLPKFDPPRGLIGTAFQASRSASFKAVERIMPATFDINTYGSWFWALLCIEGEQKQYVLPTFAHIFSLTLE